MNMNDKDNTNNQFNQLRKLGEILISLESLNLDELESITAGSYLGEAVSLLKNIKKTLKLGEHNLEKEESIIASNLARDENQVQPHIESNREINPNKVFVDYLQKVFSDTEVFSNRKSITDFFKEHFSIEYDSGKKSRAELVSKLCKMLLEKDISREDVGEALLKATNSKHGSLLKEEEPGFLKGWYESIERM
jgi:hypothetical protein